MINIAKRNRIVLRKPEYKLSREKAPEKEISIKEPESKKDFLTILTELFDLELVGINNIMFTEDEKILYEERAGIYEYYGGLSRAEAENEALKNFYNEQKAKNLIV